MNEIEIASLGSFLRQWTQAHPYWQQASTENIAAELAADASFGAIRLAGWLRTPDGELIARIVEAALPYPYNYGADVLADAIQIAARQRTERQRGLAFLSGVGMAVLVVLLLGKS